MLTTRRWEKAQTRLKKAIIEHKAAFEEVSEARRLLMKELTTSAMDLTTREAQILIMVRDKKSDKEIATASNISTRTAKFHVANILKKFAVPSRHDL